MQNGSLHKACDPDTQLPLLVRKDDWIIFKPKHIMGLEQVIAHDYVYKGKKKKIYLKNADWLI